MMNLLVLKERLIKIYQKSEFYVRPIMKFLVSLLVFAFINAQIGYDAKLTRLPVVILLSLVGAFTPSSVLVLLAAAISIGHVYFASKILAVLLLVILFILYFLFVRFTPRMGYVLLAIPILFVIKIPYVIPLLLGMIATPAAIVPAGCGVVIYYLFINIREAAAATINSSVEDVFALYKSVIDNMISNKEMMLAIGAFAAVILVTYLIRKTKIDYSFYIAIGAGVLTNMLAFLIGDLQLNTTNQIGIMIAASLASGIIVLLIQFFRLTLDYTAIERTQFEDDDYYYYVKAVPKIKVTVPKKNVQKINVQKTTGDTSDLGQTIERISKPADGRDELIKNYIKDFDADFADEDPDDFSEFEPYDSAGRSRK